MSGHCSELERILGEVSGSIVKDASKGGFAWVRVEAGAVDRALKVLAERGGLRSVMAIIGRDTGQEIEVTYILRMTSGEPGGLRVHLSHQQPRTASLSARWPGLLHHEQEISELLGVEFEGASVGRFLLPADWVGNPLRKEYVFPENYGGVEHRRAPLRKEHQRP